MTLIRESLSIATLSSTSGASETPDAPRGAPIAPPVERRRLAAEIAALDPACRVARQGPFEVYCATADRLPSTLAEIGRLREIAFRAVGEGTMQPSDLDRYDELYHHLFIWSAEDQEVVGAYRLGMVDELVARHGPDGIYTSTLFDYDPALFARLGPAIELGRSFLQPRYQRQPTGLFLLWRGIGGVLARDPRYRRLIGPVSISNAYHPRSRALMARFLRQHCRHPDLAALVEPRTPFGDEAPLVATPIDTLDALEAATDAIERRHRSLPVLLKEYLRLGGRVLELNLDPLFGDALDALILVELDRTEPRRLARYMGPEAAATFTGAARAAGRAAETSLGACA